MGAAKTKPSMASASVKGVKLSLDLVTCVQPFPRASGANEQSQVLTLKQAAQFLRISRAHLSNVINGKVAGVPPLRYAKVGRRILIKREWADEWLEKAGQLSVSWKW